MLQRDILSTKSRNELRSMMVQMGGQSPRTEKKETLIERLLLISNTTQPSDRNQARTEPKTPQHTTPEQLKEIVAVHKGLGMKVSCDGVSWKFTFGDKMDTGTLGQSPVVIRRCADMLIQQQTRTVA